MSLLRHYSLLVIIILLGFRLRTHDLQAVPLRGDEAFSVLYWAEYTSQRLLDRDRSWRASHAACLRCWSGLELHNRRDRFSIRLTLFVGSWAISSAFRLSSL